MSSKLVPAAFLVRKIYRKRPQIPHVIVLKRKEPPNLGDLPGDVISFYAVKNTAHTTTIYVAI